MTGPWLRPEPGGDGAALRLFCLPHAGGGSAAYRPWVHRLRPQIEVCPVLLPGREARWNEPAHSDMAGLAAAVHAGLAPALDRPFAVFGHSFGAATAFALTRRLCAAGTPPVALLVSGRPAPHLPPRLPGVHALPREQFLDRLRLIGGTPQELLRAPDLLEAFLPCLRADFRANEMYRADVTDPVPVPIVAFFGDRDPLVDPDEMLAWRALTSGSFVLRAFTGDHFYLHRPDSPVVAAIRDALPAGDRVVAAG